MIVYKQGCWTVSPRFNQAKKGVKLWDKRCSSLVGEECAAGVTTAQQKGNVVEAESEDTIVCTSVTVNVCVKLGSH